MSCSRDGLPSGVPRQMKTVTGKWTCDAGRKFSLWEGNTMRVATLCCVVLLVLTCACGGSGTAPSPSQPSSVFGSWTASVGSSFTRANIQSQGNLLVTHLWAMCRSAVGHIISPLTTGQHLCTYVESGLVIRTQQIDLESDGRLKYRRTHTTSILRPTRQRLRRFSSSTVTSSSPITSS